MEGVASEAASLAGHLQLGKLIVLYDDNKVTLSAPTNITFTEDVQKRFEAYGWQTLLVPDGNDIEAVSKAIEEGKAEKNRPTLIDIRTVLGYGSPHKAGTFEAHGSPLGEEEVELTKEALGCPADQYFYIPGQPLETFRTAIENGEEWQDEWGALDPQRRSAN